MNGAGNRRRIGVMGVSAVLIAFLVSMVCINVAHAHYSEGILSGSTPGSFATDITIDGSLADWQVSWIINGLTPQVDRANSDWLPEAAGVSYWIEDGIGSQGHVGPGYGGQNYDYEAAYMGAAADSLDLAIAVGTEQAGNLMYSGTNRVKPGDIFFDLNADLKWDFAIAAADQEHVTAGRAYKPKDKYIDKEWWTNPTDYTGSKPARIRGNRVEEMFDLGAAFIYTNAGTEDDDW